MLGNFINEICKTSSNTMRHCPPAIGGACKKIVSNEGCLTISEVNLSQVKDFDTVTNVSSFGFLCINSSFSRLMWALVWLKGGKPFLNQKYLYKK